MALSLGFGVLFSTFVTLLIVPSLYLILVDVTSIGSQRVYETQEVPAE
jgi:hypothetical protein